jgi:spore maturation protein CgeB
MTLNFSYHSPKKRLFRGRVWESLSCGAMLLEEDNASIRHFLEPMKHYVPFSDTRDAAEKIRFYYSNEAERKAIADKGYRMVRTRFSDKAFWSKCIRLIYA